MHPLSLQIKPGAWQAYIKRKQAPGSATRKSFSEFSERILKRDNFTCQFCGFQAKDFQEVINIDNNYQNNKAKNMATSCVFCTQCHFVESIGVGDYGGGRLIYLPEISQAELNSLCHVLFCAVTNDTGYKATAQSIYRNLRFRAQAVENEFGEGMSQPNKLGQMLIEMNVEQAKRDKILAGLRILPSRTRFREQIDHWAKTALNELVEEKIG